MCQSSRRVRSATSNESKSDSHVPFPSRPPRSSTVDAPDAATAPASSTWLPSRRPSGTALTGTFPSSARGRSFWRARRIFVLLADSHALRVHRKVHRLCLLLRRRGSNASLCMLSAVPQSRRSRRPALRRSRRCRVRRRRLGGRAQSQWRCGARFDCRKGRGEGISVMTVWDEALSGYAL